VFNPKFKYKKLEEKAELIADQKNNSYALLPQLDDDIVYFNAAEAAAYEEELEINLVLRRRARVLGKDIFADWNVSRVTPTSITDVPEEQNSLSLS